MGPTDRFAEIVQRPEPAIPLDEAALLIAAHAYDGLDVDRYRRDLDGLAASCAGASLDDLRRCLFVDAGFAGNVADYYDPRNSFLNDVLERRTGIPITLAVVSLEVARRTGLQVAGVGMPGHFLVRTAAEPAAFLDPFDGTVLDEAGCRALFHRVVGGAAAFTPAHLEPVGARAILARILANLKSVYTRRHDAAGLAWVLELRLAIPGVPGGERAELSAALAAAGRFADAAEQLELLAATEPGVADKLHRRSLLLRARLN